MQPIIFRPLADADALEAKAWYAGRSAEAAERFVEALRTTVLLISEHPYAFPLIANETRRAVLRRFPYAVYYRVTELAVIVLAVHGRQDPVQWQSRT